MRPDSIPKYRVLSASHLVGVLVLGLLLIDSSLVSAQPQAQKQNPPQFDPPPGNPFAGGQPIEEEWEITDYLLWYGLPSGLALLGLVAVMSNQKSKKKKKSTESTSASDVVGGYRLTNLMMTGQSSQVWEVVEVASGRHFAMKMLLPEKGDDQEHRHMLFHEAEVGIKMSHPNVIRIVKLEKEHKPPYFVMEFFPAGNLKIRIMHKKWDFIKEKAQDIFRQTATALAYMNANGWVHRDVKPDNIMVNSAGEVRLIDFALAQRAAKPGMFKKKGRTAGTRSYMSPEQIRGEALDGRADIYSFGATVYETITGRPPFRAATPTDLLNKHFTEKPASPKTYNADVTDEFANLVLRMLAKKKEERPRDFHEVMIAMKSMQIFKSQPGKKPEAGASA